MSSARLLFAVVGFSVCACSRGPQHVGATMLDLQPPAPTFEGRYDFELLEQVRGTACVSTKLTMGAASTVVYWGGNATLANVPEQARPAATAALINALDSLSAADSIVVTRVITEKKGDDETCASVYGRAVRLTKASAQRQKVEPADESTSARPSAEDDEDDDE